MCGINGFSFKDETLILKMNQLNRHRGPDQTDFFVDDGISLGHNRLSIIDLSERGRQPMWDESRELVIVFNGEIYNFQELRDELKHKFKFQSQTDTEVILYAYREYGAECLNKFNGIFAFAIWNIRTHELFIARDRMGIKPLYYFFDGLKFIFSSEIKAILAHDILREVDNEAFNLFFQLLYVPEPYTMFKGIKKLPAANFLIQKDNKMVIQEYWRIDDFTDLSDKQQAKEEIRNLFEDSVKKQLISDRPVGVFLSGGFDSTSVLGVAKDHLHGKVKTFSVGFEDSRQPEKFNADFLLARQTARLCNTEHHELMIGPQDFVDNLEKIVWHLDEPNHNPTAVSVFLLSQLAKKEVAVVLGGDGGDEIFGGYQRYYYSYLISLFQSLPLSLRKTCEIFLSLTKKDEILKKIILPSGAERILSFLAQKHSLLSRVIDVNLYKANAANDYLIQKYFLNPPLEDFEKQFMDIDRKSWLVDECLTRMDKMSMAFGLEARVPILDYRLVELANRIPTAWKLNIKKNLFNDFQGKQIWIDSLSKYLPPHILRQPKRGWFSPTAKWLRGGLREMAFQMLENIDERYFNRAVLRELWRRHLDGKEYNLNIIWSVIMWQMWYNCFIKQK